MALLNVCYFYFYYYLYLYFSLVVHGILLCLGFYFVCLCHCKQFILRRVVSFLYETNPDMFFMLKQERCLTKLPFGNLCHPGFFFSNLVFMTPTLAPFSKDDKAAANCLIAFLNGFWSRNPNNNQPAQQPNFGQVMFFSVGK